MTTNSAVRLPQLSVFFPCYNEEKNIATTVAKAIPVIRQITSKWEIIIVDDGSTDNTPHVASQIKHHYGSNIRIITHHPNRGYGAAFKSGFYNAKYQWIAFTDADGQFDFTDIKNLIKAQQKYNSDLVIGYYLNRQVPIFRIWGSFVWQLAVFLLFGLKVKDIDCGFKLVRKKVIDTIPPLEAERGPFITSEFLIKAKNSGFKISEVGVHHFERRFGSATGAQLKVILAGLSDLIKLRFKI